MENDGRKRRIAVILASLDIEYARETLKGVEQEAQALGMDVYIFNADTSMDETLKHNIGEYNIYKLVDYTMFDGVILFANLIQSYAVYSDTIERVRAAGIPAVSIDADLEGFYYLGVENYRPMKKLVEHLLEHHGFTKINYVSGKDFNSDSRERLAAYCDALREHGLPVEEKRIFRGAFTNEHGRDAAKKMLESPAELPEAVVCATDWIAIGVRSVFADHGIAVPDQVALTGFDDSFDARNTMPRLTTVSRNQEEVGRGAVRKILCQINGEKTPRCERFEAVPIFRESCGCVTGEESDALALRRKYLETAEHYEKYLTENATMIENLNDSRGYADFLNRLKPYIDRLQCEGFYLCLNRELVRNLRAMDEEPSRRGKIRELDEDCRIDGFPDIMSPAIACEDGEIVSYGDFPTAQMMPGRHGDDGRSHTYIFSPVHFQDYCMGYVVADNSSFALSSSLYCTWMINLSNGLESLRKQAHQRNMLDRLDRMYVTDSLTGLYNRFGFARYTEESFRQCVGERLPCMILFADLDGLKEINDCYGHSEGDVAIAAAADVLRRACSGEEVCARFGGDEFVVYCGGYTQEDAEAYAGRLERLMEELNKTLNRPCRIGISYGYEVITPKVGEQLKHYVDVADKRMYRNKVSKKNEQTV